MRIFNLGSQRRMILQQSPFLIKVNSSMGPTSASVARVISKQRQIGRNILKRSIWAKARETTLKLRKGMTFGPAVCATKFAMIKEQYGSITEQCMLTCLFIIVQFLVAALVMTRRTQLLLTLSRSTKIRKNGLTKLIGSNG